MDKRFYVLKSDRALPAWLRALVCEVRARARGSALPLVVMRADSWGNSFVVCALADFESWFGPLEVDAGQNE